MKSPFLFSVWKLSRNPGTLWRFPHGFIGLAGALLVLGAQGLLGQNEYIQRNLVSDLAGLAEHTDTNLVNPWGIAFSATSPFWISDNHSGLSTLYAGSGAPNRSW